MEPERPTEALWGACRVHNISGTILKRQAFGRMFLNSGFVEPEKKMAERSRTLQREVELEMQHGCDRYGSSGREVGHHGACLTSLLGLYHHHTVKHYCRLGSLALLWPLWDITGEPLECSVSISDGTFLSDAYAGSDCGLIVAHCITFMQ